MKYNENQVKVLKFLIENGLDINKRFSNKYPSLLEIFCNRIQVNFNLVEFSIEYGADIYATCSKNEEKTLYQYIQERSSQRLKNIFIKDY